MMKKPFTWVSKVARPRAPSRLNDRRWGLARGAQIRCEAPPGANILRIKNPRRLWKMTMGKINTFKLPSSAAPDTSPATSCAAYCAMSRAAFFTFSSHTFRQRADLAPPTPKQADKVKNFDFWN